MYIYIYIHTYTYVSSYALTCALLSIACAHIFYVYVYCMYICMCVYIYIYAYIYICMLYHYHSISCYDMLYGICYIVRVRRQRHGPPRRPGGAQGSQGCCSSILRIRYLVPGMFVCVEFSCSAILRIEGCQNSTLLTAFLESPRCPSA